MECFRELIIGPPPIVMKPSLPIRAQYRGGLLKSAARKNVINRDLRAQAYPKPLEISGDSPTRLIRPVDLASPHRDPRLLIGGCCLDAQSDHRPAECATIHFHTVAHFQHPRGAFMRNAEFLVQVGAQGQRLRSDLYLCGAQRVGGLQGMAALDALPTTRAMSDLNIEAPHNRLLDDVFLKLRPRFVIDRWSAATLRFRRQPYGNLFVHALWNWPPRLFAVIGPLLRPGRFRSFFFRLPLENGAACRFNDRSASSSSLRNRSFSACAFSSCRRRVSTCRVSSSIPADSLDSLPLIQFKVTKLAGFVHCLVQISRFHNALNPVNKYKQRWLQDCPISGKRPPDRIRLTG